MKKVIKTMLAFAALMLCGGAWASNIYSYSLAGAQLVNAGTYGAITVPEGGIMAMQFNAATGLKGMGNGNFSSVGSNKNNRKMIDTHTISGWFKVDSLPTGTATKDVYIMRVGDVTYCGYKVVVNASGQLQIGRINYDNGNYSWNTDGNQRVTFAGESGAIASDKWFHLTIAFTYSSNGTYWRLTPVAWINGTAATRSGDEYININLNGGGTVDDIRIGAKISAAGLYVDNAALSDVEIVKTLATNPDIVVLPNQIAKKYTKNDFIPSNDFVDTELAFASIDQVADYYSIGAVMAGNSINGGHGTATKVTAVTRVGSSLFAEIQCSDDGYVKCVMVELKVEAGTLRAKERHESYKSGGTVGTKYISVDEDGNCSNANSATAGTGGYRVQTLYFTPVVKPIAKWSSIEANAKGGLYGTPGYNFTMTADTGCTIADGMGKMTKNSGTANLGLKIGWNDADYTSKQLTVVFEYEDYDGSNLGFHSIFSAGWGENTDLVVYGNNNNGGNVGISSGVTSSDGGTQHMVNPAVYIPRAGKMMVTMSGSGNWTGTRIAFAPKYADGSYHNFRQVKEDTRDKVDNGQFHYVRFGGTISPIGKYHRPAINIKSVEIYDRLVDASVLLEAIKPSATKLGDYAPLYENYQDRIVTLTEGTNAGDIGAGSSGLYYAMFDLPSMSLTETKFKGAGTDYKVFPGAHAVGTAGHGWKAFASNQTQYSSPGLMLRFPEYVTGKPLQMKAGFAPFSLAGVIVEEGAANGTTVPKIEWDSDRTIELGDKTGTVPAYMILRDDFIINRGGTATLYGDITFDIASGKTFRFQSGVVSLNDGAILRFRGAGTVKWSERTNIQDSANNAAIDASGHVLDFRGKTSANNVAMLDGPLTVSDATTIHFPAGLASNEAFVLTTGTLVAPESAIYTTITVGEVQKRVALTYNTQTKSVSYDDTQATFGEEKYSTLAGAIEAAQTAGGGEVKIVYPEVVGGGVTVPSGVIINLNGNTITGTLDVKTGAYVKDGDSVLINGIATNFDITFNHKEDIGKSGAQNGTIDYAGVSGMNVRFDNAFTLVKPGVDGPVALAADEEVTKQTGAHLKHHPYVQGIANFYRNTDQLTFAVVGTMPKSTRTTFIHMGESRTANDGGYGLLIATGDEENEVIVSWNKGTEIHEITRMTVPNAATERHVYIITKNDDRTADTSTFTVYLDGNKRKTIVQSPRFMIIGGLQVGSDFGGIIKDAYNAATTDEERAKYFRNSGNDDGGIINVIRAYNRIITQDEINMYSTEDEYPYHSPNGSSSRTFAEGAANWVESSSTPWSNLAKGETEATEADSALDNASIEATLTGAATITINVAEAGIAYEAFEVKGAGSATFMKGTGSGSIRATDTATIGSSITITPGSLDISGVPVTLLEDGRITFDYSTFEVGGIYVTTKIYLTGEMDRDDAKVTFIAPTSLPYRTAAMAYDSSLKQYILTITPNHENGASVYYDTTSDVTSGNQGGRVWNASENPKAQTAVFPNDTIVFGYGSFNKPSWFFKDVGGSIYEFASNMSLGHGASGDAGKLFDGKTVKVNDGVTLTLRGSWRNVALGTVTTTGTGSIEFVADEGNHPYYAPTADAISGTAKIVVASGMTLTVTGSVGCPVEVNGTIKAGAEIATITTTKPNCFVSVTVADGVYTYTPVEVTGEDPLPLDDIKPGESVTPAQDAKPIWSDTAPVEGEGGKYIKVVEGALVVKSGAPVNGLDSFTSYVLGLDPEVATSKPYLSGADTTSTTTLKLVPAGVTVKAGYTVTPKLRVGTTPDSFSDDSTVLTDGGFTITLPTEENDKVKYYQIEYMISK